MSLILLQPWQSKVVKEASLDNGARSWISSERRQEKVCSKESADSDVKMLSVIKTRKSQCKCFKAVRPARALMSLMLVQEQSRVSKEVRQDSGARSSKLWMPAACLQFNVLKRVMLDNTDRSVMSCIPCMSMLSKAVNLASPSRLPTWSSHVSRRGFAVMAALCRTALMSLQTLARAPD